MLSLFIVETNNEGVMLRIWSVKMTKYVVIVLAAGMGKRMKAGENKQFILLEDKPLIVHTLEVFDQDDWCEGILLVTREAERKRMGQLLNQYEWKKSIHLVIGGKERQDSVYQGLKNLTNKEAIIFIHDGARPFVRHADLHRLAEQASLSQAALLAVPVTDTIKQKNNELITTLDRTTLWAAQTPQAFTFERIWQAHVAAKQAGVYGTDDASLVERIGHPVEIVEGSYQNIKITTPEDLKQANYISRTDRI